MLDLSGENLVTYILRELKDIVNRNPRFRNMGGDVFVQTSNMVSWGDLQVEIGGISASGNRLSPDYFICTQHGYAILAKLENKDGVFVEWVQEQRNITDEGTGQLGFPIPGVYYLNVDSVDEGSREVMLTQEVYRWNAGTLGPAQGSGIMFAPGIDPTTVTPTDPSITYMVAGGILYVTSHTTQLPIQLQAVAGPLTPNFDFWFIRQETHVLADSTQVGIQDITLPVSSYYAVTITDQNGYELREGIDYQFGSTDRIRLGQYSPGGYQLTAVFSVKADPTTTPVVRDENQLPGLYVGPGELLVEGQVFAQSMYDGSVYSEKDFIVRGDGTVWLKYLLRKGERLNWEARVSSGSVQIKAKKMATNTNIIPGLAIAIGDMVNVNDQVCILVSPNMTETYEVYGSKENVSFDIRVKANDRMTSSEIAAMIRSHLTIGSRDDFEANGVSIFEISKAVQNEQKTPAGVVTSTTTTLSVSAAVDWEIYLPMVSRVGYVEIDINPEYTSWGSLPGSPTLMPRMVTAGVPSFVPYYT